MLESIMNRRSIRRYTDEPVGEETLNKLLECAMLAPSAMNAQPWYFVVVDDRNVLDALRANHPYAGMLQSAPMCIAVCAKEGSIVGYYQQDCAAATMNILIAAKEMGLGTCWMGVAPRKERMDAIKKVLELPDDISAFNLIALGHPAEEPARPDRFDAARVHHNKW